LSETALCGLLTTGRCGAKRAVRRRYGATCDPNTARDALGDAGLDQAFARGSSLTERRDRTRCRSRAASGREDGRNRLSVERRATSRPRETPPLQSAITEQTCAKTSVWPKTLSLSVSHALQFTC
jgi:hypothetical protein